MRLDPFYKRVPKATLVRMLGPAGYGNLMATAYRTLPSRAKSHRVRFRHVDDLIQASDGTAEIYFCVPERASRYIWNEGPLHITDLLWSRYVGADYVPRAGEVVIDVGANIGEFSTAAAVRGLEVHAFEPDATAFAALRKNLQPFPTAVPNCLGLGDTRGERTFYLATDLADSSFIPPEQYSKSVTLQLMPLDEYIAERGIASIGLLKIEAEGFEPEVLAGAAKALSISRYVSIDCGPERQGSDTLAECQEALNRAGLRLQRNRWILRGTRDV